jgi:homoserine kinase type II
VAVYTHLGADDLAALVATYDVGGLVSAKGIAEGVSNSNWLIETTGREGRGDRFILTMYERRIDLSELPFFLGLLDHLSEQRCPVPRTIHDREGHASQTIEGKTVALIEFLPGVSLDRPSAAQAAAVGAALATVHLAAQSFTGQRRNLLDPAHSANVLVGAGAKALASIDPTLPAAIDAAGRVAAIWPEDLPTSVVHSDLFPDNVLMLGNRVTGLIDFYFACNDAMAYDLAVTHAAWSFARGGTAHHGAIGRALIEGYESVRPLDGRERASLPLLAQGACLRFVASRTEDWLDTPSSALVTRKDPMDFMRRLQFYAEAGQTPFES